MVKKSKFILPIFIAVTGVAIYLSIDSILLQDQSVDFNAQIRPIINNKCITCHGGVKQSGGFSLLFPEEALRPSESGKLAIVPGKPEESEMIRRIKHHDPEMRMPLEAEPLSEEEIELLTKWIEQGAEWEDHWAFIKPEPVDVPDVTSEWGNNEIDHFVLRKLNENDLQPSMVADKNTLLRRVTLDLTGLPPTIEELEAFLQDESPQAYEKVVGRLLSSPHFGERWASMWMDLARYADSKGYEKDGARNIWQYRDWVIRAYNDDKPYDQFLIEQLAGDLFPDPTDEELIATAFHRNTMNNDEGGTENEEFRVAAVMDRVNTTWSALQGITMECVQCHSHPYDPIRHEDYYKSYAFFNNTADEDVPGDFPKLKTFTDKVNQENLEKIKDWVGKQSTLAAEKQSKVAKYADLVRLTEPKVHPHSFDEIKDGALIDTKYLAVEDNGHSRLNDFSLNNEDQMLVSYRAGRSSGKVEIRLDSLTGEVIGLWDVKKTNDRETISLSIRPLAGKHDLYFIFKDPGRRGYVCIIDWILFYKELPGEGQAGYREVKKKFLSLLNNDKSITTPVMVEFKGDYRRKSYLFERGNWLVHGKEVKPGVPEIWNDMPEGAPSNRLGMAKWLVSKDNPLTARVMVNRLWAQLFGIGIVETQEDFGSQGFAPSHPKLLDWLALQFINEHGWSIKKQLKQIVMSATYQQSSRVTPALQQKDPKNRLLARGPRIRLSAEQVRDQALAVSGLLSDKIYGESVMPYQPEGVWNTIYSKLRWKTSKGEGQYRRALYTYIRRTSPYPSMITFDSPSREFCVARRINTNTPLQALITLNDPVFMEAAQALAERMRNVDQVEEQIKHGYYLAMLEQIDVEKLAELELLYQKALQHFEADSAQAEEMIGEKDINLAALTVVANAILNLDEFITKS